MIDSDDELLAQLRAYFTATDPVPTHVRDAAEASLTWRTIDAELAELVADSAEAPLVGVRSAPSATGGRLLTFSGPDLVVEVEVSAAGLGRRLVGQLVPPRTAEVEIRWPGGSLVRSADDVGHFTAEAVPAGPVSVVCRFTGTGAPVATSWVSI